MIKNLTNLKADLLGRRQMAKQAAARLPVTEAERVRAKQKAEQGEANQVRLLRPCRTSIMGRVLKRGSVGRVVSVREDVLIVCFAGSFVYIPVGSDLVEVI